MNILTAHIRSESCDDYLVTFKTNKNLKEIKKWSKEEWYKLLNDHFDGWDEVDYMIVQEFDVVAIDNLREV